MQHTPYGCVAISETITAMVIKDLKGFESIEYKGKAKQLVAPILKKKAGL